MKDLRLLTCNLLCLAAFSVRSVYAEPAWYCREVASERSGNVINSCGLGEDYEEAKAREKAKVAAFVELYSFCDSSIDCHKFELIIKGERTECSTYGDKYKCWRLITGTITNVERDINTLRVIDPTVKTIVKKKQIIPEWNPVNIEKVIITFNSDPSGASVETDGKYICSTPCSREFEKDDFEVKLTKQFHDPLIIKISPQEQVEYDAKLDESVGHLKMVNMQPESEVEIDNATYRYNETDDILLTPGEYLVAIKHPLYQDSIFKLFVEKGKTYEHVFDNAPRE